MSFEHLDKNLNLLNLHVSSIWKKKIIIILIKLDGDTWVLVVRNTSTLYKYYKLQLGQIGIPENFF